MARFTKYYFKIKIAHSEGGASFIFSEEQWCALTMSGSPE